MVDALRRIGRIATLLISLWPALAWSQASEESFTVLSKQDAKTFFSMSQDQWISHVERIVSTGAAQPYGRPGDGFGVMTQTDDGDLHIVVLKYHGRRERPAMIEEAIAFSRKRATPPNKDRLVDAIQKMKEQMKPEFEWSGYIDDEYGRVVVSIRIVESPPD